MNMESTFFVEGVYPDFTLLEEVLLPPCLEANSCSETHQISEWTRTGAEPQYVESPQGVAVGNGPPSASNCEARDLPAGGVGSKRAKQYRAAVTRGSRKKRKNRCSESKAPIRCPSRRQVSRSQKQREKMEYLIQTPPEPNILYLMQESAKFLPELENRVCDPSCSEEPRGVYGGLYVPSRKPPGSTLLSTNHSSLNYNAMELLNLISTKCSGLHKLDGDQEMVKEDTRVGVGEAKNLVGGMVKAKENGSPTAEKEHIAIETQKDEERVPERQDPSLKSIATEQSVPNAAVPCTSGKVLMNAGDEQREDKSLEGVSALIKASLDQELCRRKTPRKQRTPSKSMQKLDPSFQGIEFQMHLSLEKESCGDYRLIATSLYSKRKTRHGSIKSKRRLNSISLSSSSEDDQPSVLTKQSKRCASCKTQKTPLWRDAEDGTPLCNACGIRYKKYGVRCSDCWTIPKKDGKTYSRYCGCGGTFRAPV
ncbi:hypothetical protein XENTR_v10009986 [Xenopus tropicalis]|uniref:GATA-type zinc finger protein 1 n=1 Tax=Xenopus tropicalis TaxID=8364 RepID=A0A8J0QTE9_XENTR|nr:GATA-type zinc finger protein 1 [Xenopus tropicalis]KAE8619819.1 hypothetical protein XENTR_v10009986 [Xenopus tropicalis]|eukprot:XP_002939716.2 PREDICTED: GATA-type zinc finger protein 1 [Xenopus tropicalis]